MNPRLLHWLWLFPLAYLLHAARKAIMASAAETDGETLAAAVRSSVPQAVYVAADSFARVQGEAAPLEEPKKKRSARPFVLAAIAVIGIGGYVGYGRWKASRPPEWSGTVEARTIDVGSRASGRVKEVLAHEGDPLRA